MIDIIKFENESQGIISTLSQLSIDTKKCCLGLKFIVFLLVFVNLTYLLVVPFSCNFDHFFYDFQVFIIHCHFKDL